MKVGIVGAGNVGATLGHALLKHHHQVKYGSRDPTSDKVGRVLDVQPGASADSVDATIRWADVVILATPGSHDDMGIRLIAASLSPAIKGKVLIDVTNPISRYPEYAARWGFGTSGGEVLADALPDTLVYKAFNTIGAEHMAHPDGSLITGQQLTMLYAGPEQGQPLVDQVIAGVGFAPMYVGPIRYARNLEAIAELWIHLAVPGAGTAAKWGRNFHFQVIQS